MVTEQSDLATPDRLGSLPGAPLSFRLAARILLRIRIGELTVITPTNERLVFRGDQPGGSAQFTVHDWRVARRVLSGGVTGFAESYMDRQWDTPDLSALLSVFSENLDHLSSQLRGGPLTRFAHNVYHWLNRNTRRGAERNIHSHYDLGNAFYREWLDDTMTYSSALFHVPGESLERAQTHKYETLANAIGLSQGDHVLEIGSGWGGFAEYAARERGAQVTGLTISREQYDFAKQRMFENQLADKVNIRMCDYRDVDGTYDNVASIEMFEAVGEEYWPAFFQKVRDVLKPGGRAGLQIITIREDLFDRYRKRVDFIQRHVFPGGMLPSVSRLSSVTKAAGLSWGPVRTFGQDYAETLRRWAEQFSEAWTTIRKQNENFDERFRRLWLFYLAYCEAGFRTGRIDVGQFSLSRET